MSGLFKIGRDLSICFTLHLGACIADRNLVVKPINLPLNLIQTCLISTNNLTTMSLPTTKINVNMNNAIYLCLPVHTIETDLMHLFTCETGVNKNVDTE